MESPAPTIGACLRGDGTCRAVTPRFWLDFALLMGNRKGQMTKMVHQSRRTRIFAKTSKGKISPIGISSQDKTKDRSHYDELVTREFSVGPALDGQTRNILGHGLGLVSFNI